MKFEAIHMIVGITLSFLLGFAIAAVIGSTVTRSKAIEFGCGNYNETTGHFEWMEIPE